MDNTAALKLAVELVHMPSRVRGMRSEPMPHGVATLLQIAAGEEAATAEASMLAARPPQVIRHAAEFFIEQIMLYPEADSYRVLGATSESTSTELRRNMALLLRWLHPDIDTAARRSMFAGRVTEAWENLKTPDRRAAYDASLRAGRSARIASTPAGDARSRGRQRAQQPKSSPPATASWAPGGQWPAPKPVATETSPELSPSEQWAAAQKQAGNTSPEAIVGGLGGRATRFTAVNVGGSGRAGRRAGLLERAVQYLLGSRWR